MPKGPVKRAVNSIPGWLQLTPPWPLITLIGRDECPRTTLVNEMSELCMAPVSVLIKPSSWPGLSAEVRGNNGACKHFFPRSSTAVINLHTLLWDKGLINWKTTLKKGGEQDPESEYMLRLGRKKKDPCTRWDCTQSTYIILYVTNWQWNFG